MAVLKCKMCGGDLVLNSDSTIAECEYCGTQQTVPTADNEKKITLFQRANRLRFACEFDKAAGIYESIVAEFPEEAEAYWGLILCKYGIEYVDDPATAKKIPTCHRSSFDSVMDDSNFELVMEYADSTARGVYRAEAKQIEELRKSIIEVSSKEEPYDIFICYKETAPDGDRTIDSVIAQDVYDALTEKGYRVFFSRITLEDKLGQEYEPYIFAALNSAKVMLAFGTDYEYYNAVWVKNEWSRFLQLIAKGEKKTLIPCYKSIDAYDMPKEFAKLQAQDMGKVGAIQDLLRGIEKILPSKSKSVNTTVVFQQTSSAVATEESLIERGYMFLEDEKWSSADEYFEKVLDINPKCAKAYLGKLLASEEIKNIDRILNCDPDIRKTINYRKALRYADTELKNTLNKFSEYFDNHSNVLDNKRKQLVDISKFISASNSDLIRVKWDGSVEGLGYNLKKYNLSNWTNISKVVVSSQVGESIVVGLRYDGTVVASGNDEVTNLADVFNWKNIVNVYACPFCAMGLRSDGTLLFAGRNDHFSVPVDKIENVKDVTYCNENYNIYVLHINGNVTSINTYIYRNIENLGWSDIVKVTAKKEYVIGLKSDGTVVAKGYNSNGQCDVEEWTDIIDVITYKGAGQYYTVGLKRNGSIISTVDSNGYISALTDWTDMLCFYESEGVVVGLKSDNSVVAMACESSDDDELLDCVNLSEYINCWQNVVGISCADNFIYAVCSDGVVRAVKPGYVSEICDTVSKWKLFDDVDSIQENIRIAKENAIKELEKRQERYREKAQNLKEIRKRFRKAKGLLICPMDLDSECHFGLCADGRVLISGTDKFNRTLVESWKDVVSISAGINHIVGLKSDGTVVSAGSDTYNQCVNDWTNVVDIKAGGYHTIGLCANRTVLAQGLNNNKQCDVHKWNGIVKIASGLYHSVGLKSDGTVVAVGSNKYGQISVSKWTDIVDIFALNIATVGLKSDGTVVVAGSSEKVTFNTSNTSEWHDIVDVSVGISHILGLRSDGTVVATGSNNYGESDVHNWEDVIAISALNTHSVGLKADGTVVATGSDNYGKSQVSSWKDIVAVSAGAHGTVGVKSNGEIIYTGIKRDPCKKISSWKLFNRFDDLQTERHEAQKKRNYCKQGLCQHCGGEFKGLFTKKCVNCGKQKDY